MTLPSQIQETHDDGTASTCANMYTSTPLTLSLSLFLPFLHTVPSLSLTLDPSGGYYHLLPSLHSALKPDHQEQQLMYTLSLTLSNAKQLPKVSCIIECTKTCLLELACHVHIVVKSMATFQRTS